MLLLPGFLVARLRHHPLGRLTRGNLAPDSLLHIARTMRLPTKNSCPVLPVPRRSLSLKSSLSAISCVQT